MYHYIYDTFLENSKYFKVIDRIELRLADLGINGESTRVRPLRDMKEIILDVLENERPTIIIIGNDHTYKTIMDIVLTQNKQPISEITLGIIPVGSPNTIGQALSIPEGEAACDTISARILKVLDLGKVNNEYFLTRALIGLGTRKRDLQPKKTLLRALSYIPRETIFKIDEKFQLRVDLLQAAIVNLSLHATARPAANPEDGILNVYISSRQSKLSLLKHFKNLENEQYYSLPNTSIFKAKKIQISSPYNKSFPIFADNQKVGQTPLTIEVEPRGLRVIVGKNRTF